MKNSLALLVSCLLAGSGMAAEYGNVVTSNFVSQLPIRIGNTWNPTLGQLQAAGWRYVTVIDSPSPGYRVGSWGIADIDGTNARKTVATQINIADQQAAQAAAIAVMRAAEAQLDNAMKIEKGVALVTLDELNILRGWLAAYKVEVAAATSLADLKTRVAGLPATPERTVDQLKTSVSNKVESLP